MLPKLLPLKGFGIEQAEELSEDRTERYQLQLGFPSHGFKVSLVWVGHRLARAPRKSWSARLPVCLSVRPRLARVCALGGGPPGVCARQGGQAMWGKGKETSGACGCPSRRGQGLVWGEAKWCFLVLFEIKIPFLLNYPSMAHITGQVLFHHILS